MCIHRVVPFQEQFTISDVGSAEIQADVHDPNWNQSRKVARQELDQKQSKDYFVAEVSTVSSNLTREIYSSK